MNLKLQVVNKNYSTSVSTCLKSVYMHMKQRKMKGENAKGFKNWNGNFLVYHKYNMFKNNKATEMTKIIQSTFNNSC